MNKLKAQSSLPVRQAGKLKANLYFVIIAFCTLIVGGCVTIKEGARVVLGISTKEVEDARPRALKRTFDYDYDICYKETKQVLKDMGSYIYADNKDKKMIAIYVSYADTTTVGIFFNEIGQNSTQIEVASPSSFTRDTIAPKLFLGLEKAFQNESEGENSNAQE